MCTIARGLSIVVLALLMVGSAGAQETTSSGARRRSFVARLTPRRARPAGN
jgi:hypothetical protein